ncbi:assimilatory sulfite reductase (NADPH) flavoprotein subunit [Staphylococcus saprophyticus]|uniref:assimilatory sulfite reductase (NADPH) flavoprotein subunit n=1 Tax=Staphylococcus saprophyticus TaxID=29385 RepID=UPI000853BC8F|nr:assimilatory sulfite reductase (NADPH) flavoprotein subunit [Staphylococcus saprophyticus]MBC2920390.1 assimilatory sulfite reductase (NADPH) flavoprotein subunit [Staphylococcus saprophyticus]MBC2958173.1 assimilatory sulfite reductase (NADPH) flavoprotein subunit [Staphylococcus saprophyticus]MBC3008199.1 assimilatory sulfite reductase (NADPH) flavoprotein subunit [Staphylococcus saprophyticus]MBC3022710.1 assimilatory sulfite reductase (NADPH) flavoprotein subunit [Staphylococcus saprophy
MNLSVSNSPFDQEQAAQLNQIFQTLTAEQQIWLTGYLTAQQGAVAQTTEAPQQVAEYVLNNESESQTNNDRHITVVYGSETGNAQSLAEIFADRLVEHNYTVKLTAMDEIKQKEFKKVEDLFVITATHGEGDPPDNALTFHEFIHSRKAPKLENVRFSVLALGDESYEYFCQTGKDFDAKLLELGAERLTDRQDCDLDFDDLAEKWMNKNIEILNQSTGQGSTVASTETVQSAKEKRYSKSNPYQAEVLENINLNGRGSNKEVRHVELLLDNYGESFEPGDCVVVLPQNEPEIVTLLIETLGWDKDIEIPINDDGDTLPLEKALTEHFEITKLTKPLLQKAAELFGNTELLSQIDNAEWIQQYVDGRDVIDLLIEFPTSELKPETFYKLLRKLPAREYSIASSYEATPDEVHITVGAVRYEAHERTRKGVCSVQLAERIQPGDTLPIYLKKNPNFKFPFDEETPVIMIGPGTGVAPFRSYMQEREELGLSGNTWLFFGEQYFTTDFLYQTEWQAWLKDETLAKLDLAFSRDTEEKIYVQHRIAQQSELFYQWLQDGAAIYVCGDEKHMAKDVHDTIRSVIEQEGDMSEADAEAYLTQMKQEKRYQRDVY